MHILLLSYHFHNHTAEGKVSVRVAAALAARGHRVDVLTSTDNPFEGATVQVSSGPLAGVTVHRVARDESALPDWYRWLGARAAHSRAWDKVAAVANLHYGCSPSEQAWVEPAARRAVELWHQQPYDVLHSRLNPHTSHLAALAARERIPRCPWSAYFSDPWPHSLYPEPYRYTTGPVSRMQLLRVLHRMMDAAGSLIFPAERLKTYLLADRREAFRAKAFVAPHLARFWEGARPPDPHDRLVVRHAGFLMRERRIEPLYGAVRRLQRERPEVARALRVEFAGRYDANRMPEPPADVAPAMRFLPDMPTDSVWEWLQGADALLLVEAKMREGIFFPSKLAEYLAAGRPILALSPRPGVTVDLLAGGGSLIVEPDDEQGIAEAVARMWDDWRSGRLAERAPSETLRETVSPGRVAPIYEAAFQMAIDRCRA